MGPEREVGENWKFRNSSSATAPAISSSWRARGGGGGPGRPDFYSRCKIGGAGCLNPSVSMATESVIEEEGLRGEPLPFTSQEAKGGNGEKSHSRVLVGRVPRGGGNPVLQRQESAYLRPPLHNLKNALLLNHFQLRAFCYHHPLLGAIPNWLEILRNFGSSLSDQIYRFY